MAEKIVIWSPQPGPQTLLLQCPYQEIFYGGARGGGKTDGFLGSWLKHSGRHGPNAHGILFRKNNPELDEVKKRSHQLFSPLGAEYHKTDSTWTFRNGATFKFRHLEKDDDADKYQGHQYSWMAFEELPNWRDPTPVDKLRACLRSATVPESDLRFLANGNPGGKGHNWVKDRYITPADPLTPIVTEFTDPFTGEKRTTKRVFIPAKLSDNQLLLRNQPGYVNNLFLSGPSWLVKAWLEGDWDIVAGGYFEGSWDSARHIIDPFVISDEWPRWRALDWGYKKPYSVGWYTMDYDGVIYRYRELYGWGGAANKGSEETALALAKKILEAEKPEADRGIKFVKNPADSAIWTNDGRERTISQDFLDSGVIWVPTQKGPGSRINGWQECIKRLNTDTFKVFTTCRHFIRTVPILVPDNHNPEDVDTDQEDHTGDEWRYSMRSRRLTPKQPPKPAEKMKPARTLNDYLAEHERRQNR